MARRSEFVVVPSPAKPPLAVKRSRAQPPKIDIEHRSLGIGRLRGIRPSGSGGYVVDLDFAGATRTLKLQQSFFITPVADVLALLPMFLASKPPVEREPVEHADEEDRDVTPELGMPEPEDSGGEESEGEEMDRMMHS
jgi:hypothetical protein